MAPLRQTTITVNNHMFLGLTGLAHGNQRWSTNIRVESGGMSPPRIVEEDQILIKYDEKKQIPIIIQDTLTVSFLFFIKPKHIQRGLQMLLFIFLYNLKHF